MAHIIIFSIMLPLFLFSKDIDFDALKKVKPQNGISHISGYKNAVNNYNKKLRKLQRKQVIPIHNALKSIAEYKRNESDLKKLCLAKAEYGDIYCYSIKDKDTKNLCLGITKYKTNCYSIHNNDDRNLCLAVSNYKYKNMCFGIKILDTKNLCLAMTYQSKTSCFSIKNKDKRNLCLGVTRNKGNCFSIQDNNDGK